MTPRPRPAPADFGERLANIERDVAIIRRAVQGDGDPAKGLASRVMRLEAIVTVLAWLVGIAIAVAAATAAWRDHEATLPAVDARSLPERVLAHPANRSLDPPGR